VRRGHILLAATGQKRRSPRACRLTLARLAGKVRLAKWYQTLPPKTKNKIVKDVTQLVLARRTRMSNILEYKGASSCLWGFELGAAR
jgi:hypothetical protein